MVADIDSPEFDRIPAIWLKRLFKPFLTINERKKRIFLSFIVI